MLSCGERNAENHCARSARSDCRDHRARKTGLTPREPRLASRRAVRGTRAEARSVGSAHGVPRARAHGRPGHPALSRRDDVRRVGQPGSRRVDPHHPPRARRRHQLHRHRRRVRPRRVGGDRGQSAQGPARRHRPRDEGARDDARHRPEHARQLATVDRAGGRREPPPPADRLDRPLPDPSLGSGDRSRGDARCAHRPATCGQDPLPRLVDVSAVRDRRGTVGRRAARPRALRLRATAVLDPRPRRRDGGAADVRALRPGRDPVEPARGRLALRALPEGRAMRPAIAPTGFPSATTCRCPGTSRSSTRSSSSPSSPSRPG